MVGRIDSNGARAIALVSALVVTGAQASLAADAAAPGCDALPGTYITTMTDIEGVFASRGLLTFTSDGAMIVSDSRQGGQPSVYEPFASGQGVWTCDAGPSGPPQINAMALTFTLAPTGSAFGRVDYTATLDSGHLSGTIALRFAPDQDLESADPIASPGAILEEFGFEGRLVTWP